MFLQQPKCIAIDHKCGATRLLVLPTYFPSNIVCSTRFFFSNPASFLFSFFPSSKDLGVEIARQFFLANHTPIIPARWPTNSPHPPPPTPRLWRNHPKLLGPGALIFVAKQLWPKLALTGSSSSEASIKATLFQDQQTTLTRRWAQRLQHKPFHTSQSDCSGKKILLQTMFRVVKYYRVPATQLFKSHRSAEAVKKTSEITWRIDKARTNASLSGRVVSTSWRAIPLNRPTRGQSTRPSKTRKQIFEVSTWKTVPQARLSILILSKTDPSPDIT